MITKIDANRLTVLLSVSVAMFIYFYANSSGLGLTNDSIQYWQKSVIFAKTHSFKAIGFPSFFPFQSLEIVLLSIFGNHSQAILKYLHALWLGGTIFIHLIIAQKTFNTIWALIAYAATLTFSTPLLMVHSFLWTEPLFIFLVSLQWYLLWKFFQHKNLKTLLVILLISVLYCWQRKAGMLFSLGLILALTVHFTSTKTQLAGILIAIAASIFLLYGELGTTNFIGERPVISSFPVNFKNYFNALSAWLLPLPINYRIRTTLLIAVLIFTGYFLRKIIPGIQEGQQSYVTGIIIIILTYFVIRHFYARPDFDEADRFLAPVYPAIFFLFIFVTEYVVLNTRRNIFKLAISVILTLWLTYPVIRTLKNAKLWHDRAKIPLLIKEEIQSTYKK